jgi:hypothetical protein
MAFGLCYWIIMLIWFLFGLWDLWAHPESRKPATAHVGVLFILLLLLGWKVFGAPLHE